MSLFVLKLYPRPQSSTVDYGAHRLCAAGLLALGSAYWPRLPIPLLENSGMVAVFVPDHSGGPTPDSNGIPYLAPKGATHEYVYSKALPVSRGNRVAVIDDALWFALFMAGHLCESLSYEQSRHPGLRVQCPKRFFPDLDSCF
jgi:hypothetical protein